MVPQLYTATDPCGRQRSPRTPKLSKKVSTKLQVFQEKARGQGQKAQMFSKKNLKKALRANKSLIFREISGVLRKNKGLHKFSARSLSCFKTKRQQSLGNHGHLKYPKFIMHRLSITDSFEFLKCLLSLLE